MGKRKAPAVGPGLFCAPARVYEGSVAAAAAREQGTAAADTLRGVGTGELVAARPLRIVSGGQSGADIGGLIAGLEAIKRGHPVETGGWGHPKLDSEYAPRTWGRPDPGNPAENDRIVALQREAGVREWPLWIKKEVGFDPREREDVVAAHSAIHGGIPRGQHFPRTAANVLDSDATVLFGKIEGGTADTLRIAQYAQKPYLVNPTAQELADFVNQQGIETLNVAGRRQSKGLLVGDNLEQRASQTVGGALDLLYGQRAAAEARPSPPVRTLLIDSKATGIGQAVSPFYARLPDGLSVEESYQQAKGYPNWRAGKGRAAVDPNFDYEGTYQDLYQQFAQANPELMDALEKEIDSGAILQHPRASTSQNPATALTRIIQERKASREAPVLERAVQLPLDFAAAEAAGGAPPRPPIPPGPVIVASPEPQPAVVPVIELPPEKRMAASPEFLKALALIAGGAGVAGLSLYAANEQREDQGYRG